MSLNLPPIERCRYNMNKGLWETHPFHWIDFDAMWVAVGLPLAAELGRGVHESGAYDEDEIKVALYLVDDLEDEDLVAPIGLTEEWKAIEDKLESLVEKAKALKEPIGRTTYDIEYKYGNNPWRSAASCAEDEYEDQEAAEREASHSFKSLTRVVKITRTIVSEFDQGVKR